MSKAYNKAVGNRGFLDQLTEKIPGYRGYIDRDARQESDRIHREFIANSLFQLKPLVGETITEIKNEGGDITRIVQVDQISSKLDLLAQKVRSASYGSAQFFSASAAGEEELRRLHEFDLGLVDAVEEIRLELAEMPSIATETDKLKDKLKALKAVLKRVEDHLKSREQILNNSSNH